MNMMNTAIYAGVMLAALLIIGLIVTRLYRRATKEIGFVRTGFGGEKVVINGGALVLPVLHETMPVNLNTVRLAVERKNTDALITLDRLRIDVKAEFYVRVRPDRESIAIAAQTLGLRTMHPDSLKELIEGKFVDPLGRRRHDDEPASRAAQRIRPEGAAGLVRRSRHERPRA